MDLNSQSFLSQVTRPPSSGDWSRNVKFSFIYLCLIYLLNSTERGIIPATLFASANSTKELSIQATFSLTTTELGSFESFYVGGLSFFLVTWSLFYKMYSKTFFVLSLGYSLWLMACFGSAFSQDYAQFAACRFFIGAGDAVMNVLGVPWVDANVPTQKRALLVAYFSMMFVLGDSVGMILSAFVTDWEVNKFGWRSCYFGIGVLMTPFVFVGFCIDKKLPRDLLESESVDIDQEKVRDNLVFKLPWLKEACELLRNSLVVMAILGTASLQTMVAVVGYYSNGFMIATFNIPQVFSLSHNIGKQIK